MPHGYAKYPELSVAMECAKELVTAWRNGALLVDRAMSAKLIWTIQGYAQSQVFGEPDHPPLIGATEDLEAGRVMIEDELMAHLDSFSRGGDAPKGAAAAIPWPLIWMAIQLLLERLRKPKAA